MSGLTETLVNDPVELRPNALEDEFEMVIRAAYKQVLGNAHVLDAERLVSAESMLRNGDLTVRGFVRAIARSELYKSLFFNGNPPYRFIELNCKHLLGRAPFDQAEISSHVQLWGEQGYEAEIDSYLDSDEYLSNFGENIVPYPRCIRTQTGVKNNVFNQTVSLVGGFATSDSSNRAQLVSSLAANLPQKIKVSAGTAGAASTTEKRFRIAVAKGGVTPVAKQSNTTYEVSYTQLSQRIQTIHRSGGSILSITEV
ncbi:MAG: phycobilisome rod-core linker polypeptide [Cyanobacteria bacterium SID2]|nr:phycobilisome rod-core linker polypeptide [Cyanobacteria bacterium SID2]MBP0005854.1 phycobilisome rod-core linker polypeptide [Cyanobacteria bacterium SBC]